MGISALLGNDFSIGTDDFPGRALTGFVDYHFLESLYVDDRFEMYIVYFAGADPAHPSIQRPIGELPWNWGGLVVFDSNGHNIRYTNAPLTSRNGQATNSMVTTQGNVKDNSDVPCPGGPPLSNNSIDSSRHLVRYYYNDILKRHMRIRIFAALVLSVVLVGQTFAQDLSDLDRLDTKFSQYFESIMPSWKHERVEPVLKTENVLIQFWSFPNRKVKISIVPHKSAEEAREVLQRFVKYESDRQELRGFGDEAYAWGYGLGDVAFRRGIFTVYVRTRADIDSDPDARTLTQWERFEREKSEIQRLSREFAKQMVSAIDAP